MAESKQLVPSMPNRRPRIAPKTITNGIVEGHAVKLVCFQPFDMPIKTTDVQPRAVPGCIAFIRR